jgi:hypothetical protein
MTNDAAEEEDHPENDACAYEEFSRDMAFQKGHCGSTPQDINVHDCNNSYQDTSKHTASLRMTLDGSLL